MDPVGTFVKGLLDFLTPILSPDWGALVAMLPILLVIGVVGPILSLLLLGWLFYVIGRPRSRIPYRPAEPRPAELVAGVPVYPTGEPYCIHDRLILPAGSDTCPVCGREAAVRCPKCGVGRAAYIDTCANCGLVIKLQPRAVGLQPAGPPPGGAAAA